MWEKKEKRRKEQLTDRHREMETCTLIKQKNCTTCSSEWIDNAEAKG